MHNAPPIDDIDPNFGEEYDEDIKSKMICTELNIAHLAHFQCSILIVVIKLYWRIFSKKGVICPVKNYECKIDSGNACHIACKIPSFVPLETPHIEKAIAKLVELGHAKQIHDGAWLSKPLLPTKPHQENVTDIKDFLWHFCIS